MLYFAWFLIFCGSFFIISGIIGLFRFPDFYSKLHGICVIESCALPLCFFGMAIMQENNNSSFKLFLIAILIFILSPAATHAISRAAWFFKKDENDINYNSEK